MLWLPPEAALVLAVFAVYRLAQLLSVDDGPFALFERLRRAFPGGAWGGLRWSIAEWLRCPFCQGLWWAAGVALLLMFPSTVGDFVLLWLGLAGAQALLASFTVERVG